MIEKRDVCVCDRCGHSWLPTLGEALPARCAKCKSWKWNDKGATAAPQAPAPEPPAAPHKDGRPKSLRDIRPARRKASRRKGRTKVQAISAPATQASQMTTRSQELATAHAVNCACYSCHTPDW